MCEIAELRWITISHVFFLSFFEILSSSDVILTPLSHSKFHVKRHLKISSRIWKIFNYIFRHFIRHVIKANIDKATISESSKHVRLWKRQKRTKRHKIKKKKKSWYRLISLSLFLLFANATANKPFTYFKSLFPLYTIDSLKRARERVVFSSLRGPSFVFRQGGLLIGALSFDI